MSLVGIERRYDNNYFQHFLINFVKGKLKISFLYFKKVSSLILPYYTHNKYPFCPPHLYGAKVKAIALALVTSALLLACCVGVTNKQA